MSKNEKKIPEIRFKGFTEDWEQRKFKNFITKAGAKNKNGENYPAYSVSNSLGLIPQSEQFEGSRLEDLDKSAYKFVKPNEFAYNPARINVGSIAFNDIGKTVLVSSLYVIIQMSEKLDNEFALQYIKSPEFLNEVRRNTEGSVREYLFYESFKNVKLPYTPNIAEQIKIGGLFQHLDNLITLHQRKLEKLMQLKKGFMQVMFPQKNESIPKLRFANFDGEWEQRKLKDVSTNIRGAFPQPYTNPEFYDEENGKPLVQVADIGFDLKLNPGTKAHISKLAEPKSRFVEAGKVVVALQGSIEKSIGRTAITQYDAYFDRTILIFEDYKVPIDKQYFAQIIKKLFEREKERAWGATISTITKEHLNDFIVGIPSIEEQRKIGNFFKQLDNTITLHQSKVDKLQSMKRSFLQKMFI